MNAYVELPLFLTSPLSLFLLLIPGLLIDWSARVLVLPPLADKAREAEAVNKVSFFLFQMLKLDYIHNDYMVFFNRPPPLLPSISLTFSLLSLKVVCVIITPLRFISV